jgi:EpsD family peptidyl-prolyl cis-trans isomerase
MSSLHVIPRTIGALIVVVGVAACGQGGGNKEPSQVAARVNGEDVTVHQVNLALSRAGNPASKEQAASLGREALDQLVDQQLLVQKALELKLDRDPLVVATMDAARRQLLAQAYVEKIAVAGAAVPSPEEVGKFYDAHPELFAARRIYRLQELLAGVPPDMLPALRAEVEKTRNLNAAAAMLRARGIRFNANSVVQPAEQLPPQSLAVLTKMKDGDVTVLESRNNVAIVQLVASQESPRDREEAKPQIEQFLLAQARTAKAGAEMKRLRDTAKLEYLGQFATAPVKAAGKDVAAAAAGADSPAAAVPAGAAPAAVSPAAGGKPGGAGTEAAAATGDDAIAKGLRGLR